MTRKKLVVVVGVGLLFLVAGTSFALTGEWDFVSGFDEDNDVLVYGASEADEATEGCEALDATTVSYDSATTTTAPVGGGGCELRIVEVANDNGVVNHGQVVSSFVQDLKDADVEGGIGCLVREIAGSDYGKSDGDDTEDTVVATAVSGDVDLTSETVTCGRPEHAGPPEDNEQSGGRPEHAGKPEHAGPPEHAGLGGNGD